MANRDCADGKSSVLTCCSTLVAETSSSHFDSPPSCQVGRSFRIKAGLTGTSANVVATSPTSDMLVSVFAPVTRKSAVVPAALRSSASASICGAPLGLRGAVSLIAHPSLFATYGFSHACTVSSISELEKYFICMVSILLMLVFSDGVACALRTICAHADNTSSPIVARPAVYVACTSLNGSPSTFPGSINSPG